MGLDMYLYANKYISKAKWRGEEASKQFDEIVNIMQADEFIRKDLPSGNVTFQVAYWRKANQIHGWFVDNVQNGEDNCREHHVSREQLIELRSLVQEVIDDNGKASELLPTQSGFFFGSTDYDHYYFEDMKNTAEMIDGILKGVSQEWDFYYQASW